MRHPESQDEIHFSGDTYGISGGQMRHNPVLQARMDGPFLNAFEHGFLDIGRNDPPAIPDNPGHRYCEKTDTRADIEHNIAFPQMPFHDGVGILHKPAQPVVERETQPARTKVMVAKKYQIG